MRRKKWLSVAVAIAGGGGLAAGLGLLPAVGQNSPASSAVVLATSGQLLDRGAVALTTVYIVCQPGDFASLSVSLSERSGGFVASGINGEQINNCTGQIETVTIPVTSGSKPFRSGLAFGQATFQDCGFFGCNQAVDTENVALSTKTSAKK